MDTVYRAFDGTLFEDATECSIYENKNNVEIRMWDYKGIPTERSEEACIIHLEEKDTWNDDIDGYDPQPAAKKFINLCEQAHMSYDGLDEYSVGWYIWTDVEDRFVGFEDDIMNALIKIAKTM